MLPQITARDFMKKAHFQLIDSEHSPTILHLSTKKRDIPPTSSSYVGNFISFYIFQ